jgi:ABC-type glutathione transport system ATPase component
MTALMLQASELCVRFAGLRRATLGPLDLHLERGECLAVVGASGSGKSLAAAAMLGLLPASASASGQLRLGERTIDLARHSPAALRGSGLVWMPQDPLAALHPLRRVSAQLDECLARFQPGDATTRRAAALDCLRRAGLDPDPRILQSYPHRLSGGQRQRVLLALCLACRPCVLIADEPTSALDALRAAEVLATLQRIRFEEQLGLILISHDLSAVARHADRVLVLQDGRVVETAATAQLFAAPQAEYTRRLLAAQQLPAPPAPRTSDSEPLLQIDGLRLRYRGAASDAVDVPSLRIGRGEALALVGESGSGKSSLGRCLLRLIEPAAGARIVFADVDLAPLSQRHLRPLRARLQAVFQDPFASLDPRQRVGDIVSEALRVRGMARTARDRRAAELLAVVGLPPDAAQRFPHQFSGGQRQRIAIARALASEPELIVCDEAVSALDAEVQGQILALLSRLRAERGLSLLFITHDLRAAASLADRIAVMQDGCIVECGPAAELLTAAQHPYTRALLS